MHTSMNHKYEYILKTSMMYHWSNLNQIFEFIENVFESS